MTPGLEEKINNLFVGKTGIRVFWYDEHAEHCLESFNLTNAEVIRLDENKNYYRVKHQLEFGDETTNYLIYAPFPQPADSDNPFSDMIHYSRLFSADTVSLILQDLSYPVELKDTIKKYEKFWNDKDRLKKYRALPINSPDETSIGLGILAVLTNVKSLNFAEILTVVILDPSEENKYYREFAKYGADTIFWKLCEDEYGFQQSAPKTLQNLIRTLFVSDMCQGIPALESQMPVAWTAYKADHPVNVFNIIRSIRKNSNYHDIYAALAARYEQELNPEKNLAELFSVDAFLKCDTFEYFDRTIVAYLRDYLADNKEPYPKTYCNHRRDEYSFYKDIYANAYRLLEMASGLIEATNSLQEFPIDAGQISSSYTETLFSIDQQYRRFYEAFDLFSGKEDCEQLRQVVDGRYTDFLEKINVAWSNAVGKMSLQQLPLRKQQSFFDQQVRKNLGKWRQVVIISDALRYETAQELSKLCNEKQLYEAELLPMMSTIPSKTELGMAALLPYQSLEVSLDAKGFTVTADGNEVSNRDLRQEQLKKYHKESVAVNFDDVISQSRENLKKVFENANLIYIYHNKIDATGDHPPTEHEVFDACRDTINDILALVNRLNNSLSISKYFITADHGFMYLRDKISESAKITVPKGVLIDDKYKRFILSKKPIEIQGTVCMPMTYLNPELTECYVTVPKGIDLFKTSGRGLQYTHGGLSLQECIVPLISLRTERGRENKDPAGLVLLSKQKLTNMNENIDFMQKLEVSDSVRPFEAKLYFTDSKGQKISNEVTIHADGTTERKTFREKFTLHNKDYPRSEKYYLIIEDISNNSEYARYEYTIDIAFRPMFG